MIKKNIQTKPDGYSRIFNRILHEAENHWTELERDPAAKTARGVLQNGNSLIIAVLSFDDRKSRLILTARLPFKKELDMPALRQILRYQNIHRKLSSFLTIDDECNIACVWCNAAVYKYKPSLAVSCVFSDTCKLLEDKDLNELLN